MSYAGAGVTAPANGTDNSPTFFKGIFDHIFAVYDPFETATNASLATNTTNIATNTTNITALQTAVGTPSSTVAVGRLVKQGATKADIGAGQLVLAPLAAGDADVALYMPLPTTHTGQAMLVQRGATTLFALGTTKADVTAGQLVLAPLAAGDGDVSLYMPLPATHTGPAMQVLKNGVNLLSLAADGSVTAGTHTIVTAAGLLDLTQAANWGAAGNVPVSTGTGWTIGQLGAANIADGTLPMTKELEARTVAAVGSTTLTVTAVSLLDASTHYLGPLNGTVADGTISMVSSIPLSGARWTYVYRAVDGSIAKKDGTASGSPVPPDPDNLTIPSSFVWTPAGCTGYYQSQADYVTAGSPANKGYVKDARTPYLLSLASAAGAGVTYPVPLSLGGTEATSAAAALVKLGAAASNINADIAVLNGTGAGLSLFNANLRLNNLYSNATGFGINSGPQAGYFLYLPAWDNQRSPMAIATNATSDRDAIGGFAGLTINGTYLAPNTAGSLSNLGSAFGVGTTNISGSVAIGNQTGSGVGHAAYGSVLNTNFVQYLYQGADPTNEYCVHTAGIFAFNGTNAPVGVTQGGGRVWGTDFTFYSALGAQMGAFSGVHATFVNAYNGSPSGIGAGGPTGFYDITHITAPNTNNASAGFVATAMGGNFAAAGFPQYQQPTYQMDAGFAAVGSSGTLAAPALRQGWRVAFQAGGLAGNNGAILTGSHIGTGLAVRDHEDYGIWLYLPYTATTPIGISVHANAGKSIFGTTVARPVNNTHVKSVLQVGDLMAGAGSATLQSITFSAKAGAALAATQGGFNIVSSLGVDTTNSPADSVMLNAMAYRHTAGADGAGVAIGLSADRNNTASTRLWAFTGANGWQLGGTPTAVPAATWDVQGSQAVGTAASNRAVVLNILQASQAISTTAGLNGFATVNFTGLSGLVQGNDNALAAVVTTQAGLHVVGAKITSATNIELLLYNNAAAISGVSVTYRVMVWQK